VTTLQPAPAVVPAALAEPTAPVRRSWVGLLFAANLGLWMAFFTPIQILLPQQVQAISPVGKEAMLGWVTGLGALAAILANPIAGALSDRTCLRIGGREYGRRHVWTLGGAALAALSLVALADQHTILGVALAWVAAQAALNAMLATLTAAVPDRVPVRQRGGVSGWVGIPQSLGLVLGAVLVTALITGIVSGYVALALLLLALVLPFVLLTTDDLLPRTHRSVLRWRALLAGLWIDPRRHPDFAWAWGTRFMVQLGNALGTLYLLYFLTDRVKLADPEGGLLLMIVLYTIGTVATAVVAGRGGGRCS
jgi:MFS family permease